MFRRPLTVFSALAILATSCEWRPLEDPSPSIELAVVVELKAVLNVNVSVYNELIPVPKIETDMIRVMFYDPDSHKLVSQAFLSEKTERYDDEGHRVPCLGGDVNISVGKYDMICYNFDTPDTFIRGENDITTLEAYTSEVPASIKAKYKGLEDTDVLYEPDHVIVARDIGLEIVPHTGLLVIETEATTIVDTYYIQVRIQGAQYASDASAILSGMSPSNYFGLAEREVDNPSAVYFNMQKSQDLNIREENKDVLCTTFNTFGKIYHNIDNGAADSRKGDGTKADDDITPEDSDLRVTFNVIRTDGKAFDFEINMNDIFMTENALKRHWLLIDAIIDIPKPEVDPQGGGGGGFNPEVEDWEDQEGEVVI